jgi:Uma2 family endonuclease
MQVATRRYTVEDYLNTPEGDGNRYELIGGELYTMAAAPLRGHAFFLDDFHRWLGGHIRERRLGRLLLGPGVRLSDEDIVEPDAVFIRAEDLGRYGDRLFDGPPSIMIEVLSPSNRQHDLVRKFALYEQAGVPEYWIADVPKRDLAIWVRGADGRYAQQEVVDGVDCSTVLPDLRIEIATLFAEIPD